MNNKKLWTILILTAILSSIGAVIKLYFSEMFGTAICFPFEQIGLGLRQLSLQGGIQNIIAIIVYIGVCLLPLIPLALRIKKKSVKAEDFLMVVLCLLLFYVMYMMINPGFIPVPSVPELGASAAKAVLCGTVYSVIVAYLVIYAVRLFFISETSKLYNYMIILLSVTAVLFAVSVFGTGLSGTLNQINSIKAANQGNESGLMFTYVFVVLKYCIDSMSSIVSILVIISGITFITELSANPYSEDTMAASGKLLDVCKIGLIATVCSSTAFNLLQILFMNYIRNINSSIQIPLFSVVFIIGVLILSKMVLANKLLKDDNDSII